ncbi:hypothetical protein EMMF5_005221 [Cystobasidiomycetes sp. EMM_F5]
MDTHPQQHRKVSGSAAIARRLGTKLGLRKLDKPEAAASMADAISSTSSAVTAAPARMANAAIVNGQLGRLEEAQNEKQRRQRPVSVSQYGTPNQSVDFHFSSQRDIVKTQANTTLSRFPSTSSGHAASLRNVSNPALLARPRTMSTLTRSNLPMPSASSQSPHRNSASSPHSIVRPRTASFSSALPQLTAVATKRTSRIPHSSSGPKGFGSMQGPRSPLAVDSTPRPNAASERNKSRLITSTADDSPDLHTFAANTTAQMSDLADMMSPLAAPSSRVSAPHSSLLNLSPLDNSWVMTECSASHNGDDDEQEELDLSVLPTPTKAPSKDVFRVPRLPRLSPEKRSVDAVVDRDHSSTPLTTEKKQTNIGTTAGRKRVGSVASRDTATTLTPIRPSLLQASDRVGSQEAGERHDTTPTEHVLLVKEYSMLQEQFASSQVEIGRLQALIAKSAAETLASARMARADRDTQKGMQALHANRESEAKKLVQNAQAHQAAVTAGDDTLAAWHRLASAMATERSEVECELATMAFLRDWLQSVQNASSLPTCVLPP